MFCLAVWFESCQLVGLPLVVEVALHAGRRQWPGCLQGEVFRVFSQAQQGGKFALTGWSPGYQFDCEPLVVTSAYPGTVSGCGKLEAEKKDWPELRTLCWLIWR